jgi:hypothetical protein
MQVSLSSVLPPIEPGTHASRLTEHRFNRNSGLRSQWRNTRVLACIMQTGSARAAATSDGTNGFTTQRIIGFEIDMDVSSTECIVTPIGCTRQVFWYFSGMNMQREAHQESSQAATTSYRASACARTRRPLAIIAQPAPSLPSLATLRSNLSFTARSTILDYAPLQGSQLLLRAQVTLSPKVKCRLAHLLPCTLRTYCMHIYCGIHPHQGAPQISRSRSRAAAAAATCGHGGPNSLHSRSLQLAAISDVGIETCTCACRALRAPCRSRSLCRLTRVKVSCELGHASVGHAAPMHALGVPALLALG